MGSQVAHTVSGWQEGFLVNAWGECPPRKSTVKVLKAGPAVLRRERVGRVWDMNPLKSFAAIGITTTA